MTILDLPIEIILKITKHCDKKTIFNLAISNYRFRDVYIDAYRDETLNNWFISLIYKIKLIDAGKENKINNFSKRIFHIINLYEEARKYTKKQFYEAERDYITVELLLTRYQNEIEEYYKKNKKTEENQSEENILKTPKLDKILREGGKILKYYDINTDKCGKIINKDSGEIKQSNLPDDLFSVFKCFKYLIQCRVIECKIDELELNKSDYQICGNLVNDFDRKYIPITMEQKRRLLKLNPYHCTTYDWYKTICTCYIRNGKFCKCNSDPITRTNCICPTTRLWVCEYCYNNNYTGCSVTQIERNKYNITEKNSLADPKGYVQPPIRDIFLPLSTRNGVTVIDQNNSNNEEPITNDDEPDPYNPYTENDEDWLGDLENNNLNNQENEQREYVDISNEPLFPQDTGTNNNSISDDEPDFGSG